MRAMFLNLEILQRPRIFVTGYVSSHDFAAMLVSQEQEERYCGRQCFMNDVYDI